MAIGADSTIDFFGTQDTLGTTSADVLTTAFSVAGDLSTWTNDDDAPKASVVLLADFTVAPAVGDVINLYIRLLNVQDTNDASVVDANYKYKWVGSFILDNVTTAQYITIEIDLPNNITSQQYEFYVENSTLQTLPAGWDIFVTPKTIGPHP